MTNLQTSLVFALAALLWIGAGEAKPHKAKTSHVHQKLKPSKETPKKEDSPSKDPKKEGRDKSDDKSDDDNTPTVLREGGSSDPKLKGFQSVDMKETVSG